jgi:hypothetical protein
VRFLGRVDASDPSARRFAGSGSGLQPRAPRRRALQRAVGEAEGDYHPNVNEDDTLANLLVPIIKSKMGW